jgi:tetratricopeptide (TPR) repeat protein
MDKTKPSATSVAGEIAQAYALSKDAGRRRRANIKIVQNVLLIWLDNNIDDNKKDYHNTIVQLRHVVNDVNTFVDGDQCIQFINTINDNKVCMIISGSLGEHIVPRIHNMTQVDSIFIFCGKKKHHEQWAKGWSKIKGVFTEISSICEALKQASQQCEQDAISISFVATNGDATSKNLDRLDPMFMYSQIIKEILLTITFEEKHFREYIDYCPDAFDDNEKELTNVDNLRRKYRDKTPVWWYTCECFLYPMLNRALRMSNMDIIIKMGFFISDLHRQIEKLHKEQFGSLHSRKIFTVYRGQGLSKTDFDQLTDTKGGLMSFNNFLSTSKTRNVSLSFAQSALTDPNSVGILFVMTIDPSQSTTPFASINHVSYFKDKEDEVLFSMHTVFRINDIKPMNENHRLVQVDLTLTGDNDEDLRILSDRIREETVANAEGWYKLGFMLIKMGQFQKAEQVYEIILGQSNDDSVKRYIYCQFGWIKKEQGEYQEAITFYEKSLEICKKTLPPNHLDLGALYNNIGLVYEFTGDHSKAICSHEKGLEIRRQSLSSNHPDLAASYNNIGNIYYNIGDYAKVLACYEKALEIWQESLPSNHPNLANSYNNIGMVYNIIGDYSKALSCQEKALEIRQQSLPPNHPDMGMSYNNIGLVYCSMGEYSKALSAHEKALEIRQLSLPANHSDLAVSYNNIGVLYVNMKEYSKARPFYERAVNIGEQSLPSSHPNMQMYRNNLDGVIKQL